jgi:hypothetical protein
VAACVVHHGRIACVACSACIAQVSDQWTSEGSLHVWIVAGRGGHGDHNATVAVVSHRRQHAGNRGLQPRTGSYV